MRLQDSFPYEPSTFIYSVYHQVGADSFFVNNVCVMAKEQIITIGETYLMIGTPMSCTAELRAVILLDVFYQGGFINLVVLDKKTQNASTIGHFIDSDEQIAEWRIVDVDYFINNVLNEYANKE